MPQPGGEERGLAMGLGAGCRVQAPHPALGLCCSLGPHLPLAACWFQRAGGWGQAWHGSSAPTAPCCGSAGPVLGVHCQGSGHGVPLGECLGSEHTPSWRRPSSVTAKVPAGCLGLQGSASPRGQYKPCPSPAVHPRRRQVRLLTVVASLPGSLALRAQA